MNRHQKQALMAGALALAISATITSAQAAHPAAAPVTSPWTVTVQSPTTPAHTNPPPGSAYVCRTPLCLAIARIHAAEQAPAPSPTS